MIKKLFKSNIFRSLKFLRISTYPFCSNNQDPKYSDEIMNQLKNQAQQFYDQIKVETPSPIIDLIDAEHFNSLVAESQEKIILFNFFASWSIECKDFRETFYKLMKEYSDVTKIVNVDIDKFANIATQLQINTVPLVGLVFNGQFMDSYQKNQKIDKFMLAIKQLSRVLRGEEVGEILIDQLNDLLMSKQVDALIHLTSECLNKEDIIKYHPKILLYQALGYSLKEDKIQIKECLDKFDQQYKDDLEDLQTKEIYDQVKQFYQKLEALQQITPELKQYQDKLQQDPNNKDLKYELAEWAIKNKNFEVAIDTLLDLVKQDKNWQDRKAQKQLVQLFGELGNQNLLVVEGRKRLAKLIY